MPGAFRFPWRWEAIGPPMLPPLQPSADDAKQFVAFQEDRDKALEDYLQNLPGPSFAGIFVQNTGPPNQTLTHGVTTQLTWATAANDGFQYDLGDFFTQPTTSRINCLNDCIVDISIFLDTTAPGGATDYMKLTMDGSVWGGGTPTDKVPLDTGGTGFQFGRSWTGRVNSGIGGHGDLSWSCFNGTPNDCTVNEALWSVTLLHDFGTQN